MQVVHYLIVVIQKTLKSLFQNTPIIKLLLINSSTQVKILSDIICTSSNAVKIVQSIPKSQKIIFAPDENLGKYVEMMSGKNGFMKGACHVHKFSLLKILQLKKIILMHFISHPECARYNTTF